MPTEVVPVPSEGRVYRREGKVRLGDVTTKGRLRFDALARMLQDVGNDDTDDAGVGSGGVWVTRRMVVEVDAWPHWNDAFELATFCGGFGRLVVERRTDLTHSGGAIRTATIWAHIDRDSMRPAPLPQWFHDRYAPTAQGRTVSSRLELGSPPDDAERRAFAIRAVDFDVLGHVNNAVTWSLVEEMLAAQTVDAPLRAELEYVRPIELGVETVELAAAREGGRLEAWAIDRGQVAAAAIVEAR